MSRLKHRLAKAAERLAPVGALQQIEVWSQADEGGDTFTNRQHPELALTREQLTEYLDQRDGVTPRNAVRAIIATRHDVPIPDWSRDESETP